MQKTIKESVSISGIGLHSGEKSTIKLSPAEENTGLTFYLDNGVHRKFFNYKVSTITDTFLATKIGNSSCSVSTVEHLISAAHAFGIDNMNITVVGEEVPILDGSSLPFMYLLKAAGKKKQNVERQRYVIDKTYNFEENTRSITVEPYDKFKIVAEIDSEMTNKQTFSIIVDENTYFNDIAPARTYCNLKDVAHMQSNGLALGGSLENAIVFDDSKVVNEEGLRFHNECVRHKILDFIGDIYCLGHINGKFTIKNSGHTFNHKFAKYLLYALKGQKFFLK